MTKYLSGLIIDKFKSSNIRFVLGISIVIASLGLSGRVSARLYVDTGSHSNNLKNYEQIFFLMRNDTQISDLSIHLEPNLSNENVFLPMILNIVKWEPNCTDLDKDGFAIQGGICGPIDCDDMNEMVNPGAAEACQNSIDDNCNGLIDDDDPYCYAPNVIIIGWDGTQRNHFLECYNKLLPECGFGLPNIRTLSNDNIFNNTTTSGDTATKPGWTQILSGYNAEITGVYSNGEYQPIPNGYTIFEKAEEHFGSENIVSLFVSGKAVNTGGACIGEVTFCSGEPCLEPFGQPWCQTKEDLDHYENDLGQNSVVGNRSLTLLETYQNHLFLMFILFREPDVIGHLTDENSIEYSESLIDVDNWLGLIMSKLQMLGIYDRTLVYVTTDHGFDEGINRHGNAPFGIFASNDPLVVRSGDRKDISPTILDRYGISLGAVNNAPAVDGNSLYSIPSISCIPEGSAYLDYPGAPGCCADLQLISLDEQLGIQCIPATGGSGENSGYCTACGDGVCSEPENICNCPSDCN